MDTSSLPEKTPLIVNEVYSTTAQPEEVDYAFKSDFVGRARFYCDDTRQAESLEDLAGLDDNWLIVGVNLNAAGCRNPEFGTDSVHVYAVDVAQAKREGRHPLELDATGKLPVVSILCHDLTLQDVFDNMVHAQFSLWTKATADMPKRLTGYADRPNQPTD